MEPTTTAGRRAVDAATFAEALRLTAQNRPDEVAVRTNDDAVAWTWRELRERVDALAGGLAKLGLKRGDTMAILLSNRPEFHLVDLAAVTLGVTPFSIYNTYAQEQIEYVVGDAEARVLVTEPALLENVLKARDRTSCLEHVVLVEGKHEGCLTLEEVVASADPDFDAEAAAGEVQPEDLLTLIYTSGTTGPPKGVQLTHRNLLAAVKMTEQMVEFEEGSRVISWLPAAHVAERCAHHYLPIAYGLQVTCCPNPRQILEYVREVHPHWFFAVPRIWEKLKAGLETMLAAQPEEQRRPVEEALEAALEKVRLEQAGDPVPEELAQRVAEADERIFSNLRAMLGFDELKVANVGAAPTPREVIEFFHALGVPLGEIWGMSETCGAGTANPPDKIKIGTVGPPAPGVEIKLADDGEILMRADVVTPGYRNMPDKTAEAIDDEGWLHTGDIGRFDDDGYLMIVDRKKEIIINAAGKNMSPAYIEATLKAASPMIGQACVIGDGRRYNTALLVLDADFAPQWAAANGLEGKSLGELAEEDAVRAEVQAGVDAANAKLARVEQIKKFEIVRGDWEPGGDELTPTMKLKRRPIEQKYEELIERMYADDRGD